MFKETSSWLFDRQDSHLNCQYLSHTSFYLNQKLPLRIANFDCLEQAVQYRTIGLNQLVRQSGHFYCLTVQAPRHQLWYECPHFVLMLQLLSRQIEQFQVLFWQSGPNSSMLQAARSIFEGDPSLPYSSLYLRMQLLKLQTRQKLITRLKTRIIMRLVRPTPAAVLLAVSWHRGYTAALANVRELQQQLWQFELLRLRGKFGGFMQVHVIYLAQSHTQHCWALLEVIVQLAEVGAICRDSINIKAKVVAGKVRGRQDQAL